MKDERTPTGEIRLRSPLLKKLDNFFYHYKWHTIIALFLAVAILLALRTRALWEEKEPETSAPRAETWNARLPRRSL